MRGNRTAIVAASVLAFAAGFSACGAVALPSGPTAQSFLSYLYTQAPDIGSYRSSTQLLSLGQAVCDDLRSGASVQQLGDRLPLTEGSVALPPADLGLVISSAVVNLCPQFHKELG